MAQAMLQAPRVQSHGEDEKRLKWWIPRQRKPQTRAQRHRSCALRGSFGELQVIADENTKPALLERNVFHALAGLHARDGEA